MAWYNALFNWGVYKQNRINEEIDRNLLLAPQIEPYHFQANPYPYQTTADQNTARLIPHDGIRYYGTLPSQGDWFSPPPNPAANQSWK